jgi:hypothetical protein
MSDPDITAAAQDATPDSDLAPQADGATDTAHQTAAAPEPSLAEPVPHAGARYAALRFVMLLAVAGVLYVIGMRGWLLAFTAVLVSGIVSLFLLMKQRNDAAVNLERQLEGWRHRHEHQDGELAEQ